MEVRELPARAHISKPLREAPPGARGAFKAARVVVDYSTYIVHKFGRLQRATALALMFQTKVVFLWPESRREINTKSPDLTRPPVVMSRLDVSQWIVAHGRLSARTTLRHDWMVTPESPDRVIRTQFNAASYNGRATNMRYQVKPFQTIPV